MRDDDELPDDEETDELPAGGGAGRFAAGLALGALVGAAVALLFAPAPGRVTRRRLRDRLDDARELAQDEFTELSERARKEIRKRTS
jgi:gas vesicle protein